VPYFILVSYLLRILQRTSYYWLLEHLQIFLSNTEVKEREELHLSFPGVKWPGRATDYPHPSSGDVEERVELYLYSQIVPLWQGMWGLTLILLMWTIGLAPNNAS
jgi:hypothetical protein